MTNPARAAAVALVLLMTGCSMFSPSGTPASEPGSAERACEDAADQDPAVRNFWGHSPANLPAGTFTEGYQAARRNAVVDCMRIRSGRPKGGVEKVIQ